jgi:hypothetical protein
MAIHDLRCMKFADSAFNFCKRILSCIRKDFTAGIVLILEGLSLTEITLKENLTFLLSICPMSIFLYYFLFHEVRIWIQESQINADPDWKRLSAFV